MFCAPGGYIWIKETLTSRVQNSFVLNSYKQEIFSVNTFETANNSIYNQMCFSYSTMFGKKEFAIVGNLRLISRTDFMLS